MDIKEMIVKYQLELRKYPSIPEEVVVAGNGEEAVHDGTMFEMMHRKSEIVAVLRNIGKSNATNE